MPWVNALPYGDTRALKEVPYAAAVNANTRAELVQFARELFDKARQLYKKRNNDRFIEDQIDSASRKIGEPLTDEELSLQDPRKLLDNALTSDSRDTKLSEFIQDNLNTAPNCSEIALSNISDSRTKDEAAYEFCYRFAIEEPDRVAATALTIQSVNRMSAIAFAANAYSKRNKTAAAYLADLAVDIFNERFAEFPSTEPYLQFPDPPDPAPNKPMPRLGQLYYIASANTPKVRALLERCENWARKADAAVLKTSPDLSTGFGNITSMSMMVAGAWAQIDLPRAETLVQEALKLNHNARIHWTDGNIDGTVDRGYLYYLIGVLKQDGKRAGTLAKALGGMPTSMAATQMADMTYADYPEQLREFQTVCPDEFVATVEQRQLLERIVADRTAPPELINQLDTRFQSPFAANREELPRFLCKDLVIAGRKDHAMKIASILKPEGLRATAYMSCAEGIAFQNPEQALPIYKQAAQYARDNKNTSAGAIDLVDIANSAITLSRR